MTANAPGMDAAAAQELRASERFHLVARATTDTIWFGPESSDTPAAARLPFPDLGLDGPWMMLVQAMWFQLLSYRVAVVNDIEPGMFFEEGWIVK